MTRPPFCLLFDMDGTLTDTDPLHFAAFNELLGNFGRGIGIEEFEAELMGNRNSHIMPYLFPDESPQRHLELASQKEEMFRARIRDLDLRSGFTELLDWAAHHDCAWSIVTNAPRPNAELMLNALGVAGRFDHVVVGDELPNGKPHPMPYLVALQRLGGDAEHAVAFEDSVAGIQSASAAGIETFGIRTTLPDEVLIAAGAVRVLQDFRDAALLEWIAARVSAEAGAS